MSQTMKKTLGARVRRLMSLGCALQRIENVH